jgi:ribonuclease P protein component
LEQTRTEYSYGDEKNLSAEPPGPQPPPWLPFPHGHQTGRRRAFAPPRQGPQKAKRLKASREQLKSLNRLRKRPEFLRVHQKGRKQVAAGVIVQALPNDSGQTRFGITVSKKLSKSAVRRNRMRRRLRAAAGDILSIHARPGTDFVLIGRPETATRPYDALCEDLRQCLEKMKLLNQA